MPDPRPIIILAEHDHGVLRPAVWEALALTREIQDHIACPIQIVVLGDPVSETAERLAEQAGEAVLAIQTTGCPEYHPEVYLQALTEHFFARPPAYLVIPHNSRAWELAPRLAFRLNLACLTGIIRVVSEEGRLGFLKPFYGGKINAWIKAETDGAVLTFESGYFKGEQGLPGRVGTWAYKKVAPIAPLSEMLETLPAPGTGADLRAAQTIIAAGRGIGKPENLERIRTLAAQFPRSAVAGSRPLCDLGWLQYNQQVGQTGATVSPRLYLACGISGAYQHVAGMKDSGFIVSINRDSRAAISNWADLCVVEDLETFVPLLIASLQALKKDE